MLGMLHPDPYAHVDPQVMAAWLGYIRKKTPGEKIALCLTVADMECEDRQAAMRAKYPQASGDEVFLRAGLLNLGRAWMIRVYGWDPDAADDSDSPYSLKTAIEEARWRQRQ
jgi:hypothetical protein